MGSPGGTGSADRPNSTTEQSTKAQQGARQAKRTVSDLDLDEVASASADAAPPTARSEDYGGTGLYRDDARAAPGR